MASNFSALGMEQNGLANLFLGVIYGYGLAECLTINKGFAVFFMVLVAFVIGSFYVLED